MTAFLAILRRPGVTVLALPAYPAAVRLHDEEAEDEYAEADPAYHSVTLPHRTQIYEYLSAHFPQGS